MAAGICPPGVALVGLVLVLILSVPDVIRCSSPFADSTTAAIGNGTVDPSLIGVGEEGEGDGGHSGSTIYFNNPHLLKDVRRGPGQGGARAGLKLGPHDSETIGGIYLRDEARLIGAQLRGIADTELGVASIQAVFDSLSFGPTNIKEEDTVKEMGERLRAKLVKYTRLLERSKRHVHDLYWWHLGSSLCHTLPCCAYWADRLQYSHHFGKRVSRSGSCDVVPPLLSSGAAFCPGQNLTQLFRDNLREQPTVKWQYFITADSAILTQYPAHDVDARDSCRDPDEVRHRELYISTVWPQTKFVMIVVDHGNSLSPRQLAIAKAVAKYVLGSLSHTDQVGLIGLSAEPSHPRSDDCLTRRMVPATLEAKLHFNRFVDGLSKAKDAANHSLGFSEAFKMMRNTLQLHNLTDSGSSLIVYISRGLLSSLTDAKTVLETISFGNGLLGDAVAINTYAVIDEGKPLMYEKRFLQDVADQNLTKFLPQQAHRHTRQGVMLAVNATRNLASLLGNPFEVLGLRASNRRQMSALHWDALGKGLVVSVTEPCFHGDTVIGMVGLDVHLADLAEDVTGYGGGVTPRSYAFMADAAGYVLVHPLFLRDAASLTEQPVHTDVARLENRIGFADVWDKMSRMNAGVEILVISAGNSSDTVQRIKYAWKRVDDTPYIVCIVTELGAEQEAARVLRSNEVATPSDVVYHRLDLGQEVRRCRHLKQLATTKAASLFLSSLCFHAPFEFLSQEETRRSVQGYMAYISDNTKLIANPGLKSSVRSDVSALVHIIPEWKRRFVESPLSQYIVRRFVASPRGVFQVYPGTRLDKSYEPTRRPWYSRALEQPGRVILGAPYLDSGGAGYIVTMSHTVHEGSSSVDGRHFSERSVAAVVGADLTMGYVHKMVTELMPVCLLDRVACFVLDDRGYLISHPGLVEPSGRGPVEQQHITHKEPLVANDILNHKALVRKKLCNSFGDRTVQRFYQFNTSLESTLTNLVHGEHCAKYQIVSIPGTNAFVGIVNQTCDMVTAFCPCSMVDRLCLNCHRMEQSECECPCECPLEVDLCTLMPDRLDANPSCLPEPSAGAVAEEGRPLDADPLLLDTLEPCVEVECPARHTRSECFGVLGCEWCELDSDGIAQLSKPFCVEQRRCFGGVLGARTPYADEVVGLPSEELVSLRSTPVGPVAGGIMGCFLVLALGVYCYRHHVHRSAGHHYASSGAGDAHVRMAQLDEVDDAEQADGASATVGHSNLVLASFESALKISPYRINTGYRRPAGGDSDHGYSTMTPHEDSSEHAHNVEPLLVGRRPPVAPSTASHSVSSRTSSPLPLSPPPPPYPTNNGRGFATKRHILATVDPSQTTILPEPHNFMLASVQVHMVDSH